MAEVVLGAASSHGPQLNIPDDKWILLKEKDERDSYVNYSELLKTAKPGMEAEITPEKWKERYQASHHAMQKLSKKINECKLDALVLVADDQDEQYTRENMPMFAVMAIETLPLEKRFQDQNVAEWRRVDDLTMPEGRRDYPGSPELAGHIVESMRQADFDLSVTKRLRPTVLGHAFTFLYRWVLPECTIPVVPVAINSFYPPNQPTPRRCYSFGEGLRKAIRSWKGGERVGVLASGGLSHVVINEDIDRPFLEALQNKDVAKLTSWPENVLRGGTSELRNWIVVAGAADHLDMTLIDYVPCYRSLGGTGCGMGFAYWN